MSNNQNYKIVVLGEGECGKTSLILRFAKNKFDPNYKLTENAYYLEKQVQINNQKVTAHLWDTAGQERYHSLNKLYYQDAIGAVIVYNIEDTSSFDRVEQWIKELKEYSSDPNLCLAIAATKCDLENNRRVPKEKGPQLAKKYQAIHHLTSSKANTGIFEMFEELLTNILKKSQASGLTSSQSGGLKIIPDKAKGKSKSKTCC